LERNLHARRHANLIPRRVNRVNRLAQQSLEALAREALEEELRAAYDAWGSDGEETDVEFFLPAFREVLDGE